MMIVTSMMTTAGASTNSKIESFVERNEDNLSLEMAQGEGEELNALAKLHGCDSKDGQSAFAEMTRKSFEKIIGSDKAPAQELVQNLKKEISEDSEVLELCHSDVL